MCWRIYNFFFQFFKEIIVIYKIAGGFVLLNRCVFFARFVGSPFRVFNIPELISSSSFISSFLFAIIFPFSSIVLPVFFLTWSLT